MATPCQFLEMSAKNPSHHGMGSLIKPHDQDGGVMPAEPQPKIKPVVEQSPCVGLSGQRRRGFPGFHFLEKSLTIYLVRRRAYLNAVERVR